MPQFQQPDLQHVMRKRALIERNKDRIADKEFSSSTHTDIRRRIREHDEQGAEAEEWI